MKKLPTDIANRRAKLVLDNLLLSRKAHTLSSIMKVSTFKRRKVDKVTVKVFKDRWYGD